MDTIDRTGFRIFHEINHPAIGVPPPLFPRDGRTAMAIPSRHGAQLSQALGHGRDEAGLTRQVGDLSMALGALGGLGR